jgi:cyclophilin family peptidyl-prolyl cis-trans isomerase
MNRFSARFFTTTIFVTAGFAAACKEKPLPLQQPDTAAFATPAPDSFRVDFETSRGTFVVEAHRDWAPYGVDRFYHLVREGYYDENRFFRVVPGFVVQWGIHGDPNVSKVWREFSIADDSVRRSNTRGMLSYASGLPANPHSRTTQLFINLVDNAMLDGMGFAPIAEVVSGMTVVDSLFSGYGEGAPGGNGPDQGRIQEQGNAYLLRDFPRLDYIKTARVVGG